jgi:WD40 repeat protein
VYNLDLSGTSLSFALSLHIKGPIQCATWNPHNQNLVAFGIGSGIQEWDIKSNQIVSSFESHEMGIRSIDYNHNRPNYIASSGDDCTIRIWDIKNNKKPCLEISDHSHWFFVVYIGYGV